MNAWLTVYGLIWRYTVPAAVSRAISLDRECCVLADYHDEAAIIRETARSFFSELIDFTITQRGLDRDPAHHRLRVRAFSSAEDRARPTAILASFLSSA